MQVDGNVSDCHLLQLRFGYMHYPRIYCSLDLLVLANFIKATVWIYNFLMDVGSVISLTVHVEC